MTTNMELVKLLLLLIQLVHNQEIAKEYQAEFYQWIEASIIDLQQDLKKYQPDLAWLRERKLSHEEALGLDVIETYDE